MSNWSQREIGGAVAPPGQPLRFPYSCPPLVRCFGAWGLFVLGAGAVRLGQYLFGVRDQFWVNPPLSLGEIALLVGGFVVGTFGMVLGWGAALSIPVKDEANVYRIATLWHFQACGVLVWVFVFALGLTRAMGKEAAEEFLKTSSEWLLVGVVMGITVLAMGAAAIIVLAAGVFQHGRKPASVAAMAIVLPVTLCMGYLEFHLLSIEGWDWVGPSVLTAVGVVLASGWLIDRDMRDRKRSIERHQGGT